MKGWYRRYTDKDEALGVVRELGVCTVRGRGRDHHAQRIVANLEVGRGGAGGLPVQGETHSGGGAHLHAAGAPGVHAGH